MFAQMEPVYKTLKGWKQSTVECRKFSDLPDAAQKYLEFIEQELDAPIAIVSVGPKRDNTIIIEDPIHGPKRVLSKAVPA